MFHPFKGTIINLYIVTSSCICPSDFCRCILSIIYYTKVVFSPPPILNFLRPLR